ncbi:MAG: L-sorbosone dehydrogenase [Parcubacteria bacterium C7867-007]|nr:MAG: L-sorbosone dehydrogenase [Parcubacteria bacterium C7867-007]
MNKRTLIIAVLAIILVGIGGYSAYTYVKEKPPAFLVKLVTKTKPPPPLPAGDSAPLTVPEGFIATIYSRDVPRARVMTRDSKGTMLVSQAGETDGKVVALPDADADGKSDRTVTVLEGLNQPHGITVICPYTGNESADQDACLLYVAETGSLKSYSYDADTMTASNPKELTTFPTGDGHFTRTLLPSGDLKNLFISIGSSCNVCTESNPLRATIQTFDLTTNTLSTFATGLRNSVFMATNPIDGELWATDNGRDILGDDIPPDEVNIVKKGAGYGWPFCYGNNILDTDFGKKGVNSCTGKTAPHKEIPAHSAPLGLAFVPEEGWPDEWGNDLLVALHGSWNRSTPSGYKVVRVDLDNNSNPKGGLQDFVTGFIPAGSRDTDDVIGRPAGLMAEPGGVLYVSDDRQGAIYKISLKEPAR